MHTHLYENKHTNQSTIWSFLSLIFNTISNVYRIIWLLAIFLYGYSVILFKISMTYASFVISVIFCY